MFWSFRSYTTFIEKPEHQGKKNIGKAKKEAVRLVEREIPISRREKKTRKCKKLAF